MSDWVDWQQNRRIKQLQNEVSAAYSYAGSQTRTLQAKLAQVQGTLEIRLNRLAKAFDAFVELSDLRLELAVYAREAATRHHARRLVAALGPPPAVVSPASDGPVGAAPDGAPEVEVAAVDAVAGRTPVELEDAPGYWLTPATEALSALTRSNGARGTTAEAEAEAAIATAATRDRERTALFLALALTHAGLPQSAVRRLDDAFAPLGANTTRGQRRLWLACADGVYGAPGRVLLTHRLADLLADPAIDDLTEGTRWAHVVRGVAAAPARAAMPSELTGNTELTEPLSAANRLAALRSSIEKGLGPAAPAAAAPDVADLIDAMIEEGAPEELPLLRRARELRQIIETGAATAGHGWQDDAGSTLELLRSDAFGARPGPREIALRAGARWLTGVADDLAARAAVRPPDEVTVRIAGTHVRVRRGDPASPAEAEENIERTQRLSGRPERAGLAAAAGGVALIGVGVAVAVVLIVLGVGSIIAGGALWYVKRRNRLASAAWAEEEKARVRARSKNVAQALDDHHAEWARAAAGAAADRDAIKALLT